jgi:hypothetical protein
MRSAAWVVVLVLLAGSARTTKAEEDVDEDLQLWSLLSATFVLDAGPIKLVPYLELQPRFDDDAQDLDEVQHRAALLVRPIDQLSLGPGFVWVASFEESYEPECRVYEEARWDGGPLGAGARLRLEQRFFEGPDSLSHRVRLRVSVETELLELADMPLSLVLSNEAFANLNDTEGHREGFDQNRAFAGLSLKVAAGIKLTTGYMAVLRNRWGAPDELGHTIVVQLDFTFE